MQQTAVTLSVAVAASLCISTVLGYKFYQNYIPNGNSVPNPSGGIWEGVGHEAPEGKGPRNQFGVDFKNNNHVWNAALCNMDSDGDGKTNGQELGDPQCRWTKGGSFTPDPATGHPGVCDGDDGLCGFTYYPPGNDTTYYPPGNDTTYYPPGNTTDPPTREPVTEMSEASRETTNRGGTGTTPGWETGTPSTRPPRPWPCKDLKETCVEWVYQGYCDNPDYKTYMTIYCRKSCFMCHGTSGDVDGQWGRWSSWGACSTAKTCGRGLRKRERYCTNPRPRGLGRQCEGRAKGIMTCEITSCSDRYYSGPPQPQPSVFSPGKDHALYLWIHLKPEANAKEVAKSCTKLQKLVDQVVDPSMRGMRDEDTEVLAGVGFGPDFYSQVGGKAPKNYTYTQRKGALGDMPSSGGDIFVHAKSNDVSKLFELNQLFLSKLPKGSVENFEDIYSFVYRNGRDLSGFIDGTENRADPEGREEVAVEKTIGGSYVITQKWLHDMDVIANEKTRTQEAWVGRNKTDSRELCPKSITSHVARMTSGNQCKAFKPVEIVRQSMPFGSLGGEKGLFFIGYAADPNNFEYMLNRMVGAGGDGHSDDIMRLSKNIKGTYWYFPGQADLAKLA